MIRGIRDNGDRELPPKNIVVLSGMQCLLIKQIVDSMVYGICCNVLDQSILWMGSILETQKNPIYVHSFRTLARHEPDDRHVSAVQEGMCIESATEAGSTKYAITVVRNLCAL